MQSQTRHARRPDVPTPISGARRRRSVSPIAALAAVCALTLTACGGGDDSTAPAAVGPNSGPAEGTVTYWDTSDATNEAPAYRELIDAFTKSHPKIKVNYVNVPFSQAQEKFRTSAQGDSGAPDVLRSEAAWTSDFASQGYLADLTAIVDSADYLATPLSSNQIGDKLYGVPQVTDAPALVYNKAYFAKAGVEVPATWAEVEAAAPKLKSAVPALQAAIFLQSGGYFSLPFIYSEGGDLLDVDQKKILINSPAAAKGMETAVNLVKSGAAKADTTADSYNNMVKAFKDGTTAMIVTGPWEVANIVSGKQFSDADNLGIAPIPAGSSGKSGSPVGGHNYVMYSKSKVTAASAEFVEFMNSAKSQAFIASKLGLLPTRKSAYQQAEVKANPVVTAFAPVLNKSTARPWIPEGGGLFAALDQEYPKALAGKQTAQQAVDNVAKAWKSSVVTDFTGD